MEMEATTKVYIISVYVYVPMCVVDSNIAEKIVKESATAPITYYYFVFRC